jgi:altronate dehydratase
MMKWHGHTPEQNPSGGNLFRGLYNIALKSLGAAQKRHPDVRLDRVVDYAERMDQPGYYFMNSPGNDLESIAGQVASGSNLILFSTGNGSITNFPFVPTVKVMSTTARYQMLPSDMDFDAGAHLTGTTLKDLAEDLIDHTINVASSHLTSGERASHSQVSIWRNWHLSGSTEVKSDKPGKPRGKPVALPSVFLEPRLDGGELFRDRQTGNLALLLPNSLCSSEVARLLASRLNRLPTRFPFSSFVSLTHTEGCGAVRGSSQDLLVRTLIGYMNHPLIHSCLMLEHGCENVHHQYLRREIGRRQLETDQFGWVSIQLDGGIDRAAKQAEDWFKTRSEVCSSNEPFTLGIVASGTLPERVAACLAVLARTLLQEGMSVVIPEVGAVGDCEALTKALGIARKPSPTLKYAERIGESGFHVMEAPSHHWVEVLTGLGASGTEIILAYVTEDSCQGHSFVPVLQFSTRGCGELDLVLSDNPAEWPDQLLEIITETAAGRYVPQALRFGNTDSQVPRGLTGFSV